MPQQLDSPSQVPPPPSARTTTIKVELNLRTLLLAVATLAGVWLFIQVWPIALVIVVALMIMGALSPLVEWLASHKVKRVYAIVLVFFGILLVSAGLAAVTVPRLVAQISDLVRNVPELQKKASDSLAATRWGAPFASSVAEAKWPELLLNLGKAGLAYSPQLIADVGYCVVSLFLALYLLIERDRLRGALFSLLPRTQHVRLSRVLLNLEVIVGGYLRGQVITSAMSALYTFIVLSVAHVPSAIAIAVFAGLGDVLPYMGSFLACGPAVLAALTVNTSTAIVVLLLLAAYQEFESRVIVPQLYGKVLRLPAAVIMVSLLVGGKVLGIVGALLALPIAAGVRMMVTTLRVELPGEPPLTALSRAEDAQAELEFERRAEGASAGRAAEIAMDIATEQRLQHPSEASETKRA
jgi:putative heme transporter